ncbi:Wzz/FepE/Etk N-terminal domain-containing protein [Paractinoplanes atraurantiacus]|uniref:G-rich domain on putative tyrosine kinase n=1 Tax=Paractinoplanes atraurantiacus TaxID=1036182 RepID=A0A285IUD6_9ACTN|nr:Wzz/FepE/Etk N-terminal domain-containing protein [Actinoplanes atraurantiacus]SNY51645.1 G-rich domain on putative tyrosine kinase [Actinoplanes atraurantiacus]
MEASRPADVSHYLGVFRRHWWIALIATGAGLGAGAGLTSAMPKVYQSSTAVLVQAVDQDTNAQGGRTKGSVNLDTEAQLVGSGAVATKAAALLRSDRSPIELAKDVSVEVPANTTVLMITFKADSPEGAQSGSHAFAEAYLRNREETAQNGLDQQIKTLTAKIKQLTTTLTGINARLARATRGSSDESNLQSLRQNSQNQLNGMTGKLNELTTTTVGAGSIISDARLPEQPVSPNAMINIATGGMLGLLFGLALAFVRERYDRRLRSAADVRDRGRMNVLAALDERTTPHFDDVLQPYGAGGRVFNRLRNEVLATLPPEARTIVVTGASRGSASTLVAANLAAALARTGSDVVLIGAHLPDSVVDAAPLARMLGVSAVPGLSDLLAGRVGLTRVLQRCPRIPSLRVITTGGAATAAGLMQSQRLRDTLETLRGQGGYVVIEAPSTASSADAQSLASLADAAILAVELRRARRPALIDAAEQLQRVGTPLLGAVVLPHLTNLRTAEAAAPVVTLTPAPASSEGPRPDETAVLTAPQRFPTNTVSSAEKAALRQRDANHADEITAVIDMSGKIKNIAKDGDKK